MPSGTSEFWIVNPLALNSPATIANKRALCGATMRGRSRGETAKSNIACRRAEIVNQDRSWKQPSPSLQRNQRARMHYAHVRVDFQQSPAWFDRVEIATISLVLNETLQAARTDRKSLSHDKHVYQALQTHSLSLSLVKFSVRRVISKFLYIIWSVD